MIMHNDGSAYEEIDSHDFGEISELQDVFSEVKKLRKTRHPQHVMIVEDDPLTRRIVSHTFKKDYALICARDANDAVADYLMYAPDVVFLDIGLPDASGFAVLRQILACDPDAYIVMFSGNSYPENIDRATKEGASGFVAKPFRKNDLHQFIKGSMIHHHKHTPY